MKEAIRKEFDNAPKRKDDEKTQIMQMIGWTFSRIKSPLKLPLKSADFN